MFVVTLNFNTKNITTFSDESIVIQFEDLMKNADVDFLKRIEPPSIMAMCLSERYNLFHLNQKYQQLAVTPAEKPLLPFLLFPLFRIRDLENKEINYSFFQSCNFNVIFNFSEQTTIGHANQFLLNTGPVNLNIGGRVSMNMLNYDQQIKNGYFIFKDPNSDCAMLYYGVLIDSSIFRSPCCEFTKLYNYYILRKNYDEFGPVCSDFLYPEGITIELQIDIKQLLSEISGTVLNEANIPLSFYLRLNRQLSDTIMKVYLKGEIIWGQLYFKILKYSGPQEINDMFLEIFFLNNSAQDFYENFCRRLILTEHH